MSRKIASKTIFDAQNLFQTAKFTFKPVSKLQNYFQHSKIVFKPQIHFQAANFLSGNKKPPKLPLERFFLYFRYQISVRYVAYKFKRQLPQFYVRRNQFHPHIVPDMITFARRLTD